MTETETIPEHLAEQFDRLPPHDLAAERALLASVMLDQEGAVREQCRTLVGRDDFYQPDHQILWDVVLHLHAGRKPVDAILVRQELVHRAMLEEVGGTEYLRTVLHEVPNWQHGPHYAGIVRDLGAWRRMIALGNDIIRTAYGAKKGGDNASASAAGFASRLSEVAAVGSGDGFRSVGDLAAEVVAAIGNAEGGPAQFIRTGYPQLDELIGGLPVGGFTMVAGRPMMGKSWFGKSVGMNIATVGRVVAHITIEETASKVATNLLSAESGVANHLLMFGRELTEQQFGLVEGAAASLAGRKYLINEKPVKLRDVEAAIALAKHKHNAEVVLIDYLQLIEPDTATDNENRELTKISKSLKAAFKLAGVAGVCMVQLNRGNELGTEPPPPTLKNLRGSGSLEQDGDVILMLHSRDYYHRTEPGYDPDGTLSVIVAKNKNNALGTVPFKADHERQQLFECPPTEGAIPEFHDFGGSSRD